MLTSIRFANFAPITKGLTIGALASSIGACTALHDINPNPAPLTAANSHFIAAPNAEKRPQYYWFDSFENPELRLLISAALDQNFSVKQAIARLKQARAVARQSDVQNRPRLDLEATLSRRNGLDTNSTNRELGVSMQWEVDIFERLGAVSVARNADALARAEDVIALKHNIAAELAQAYYGAVAARDTLNLLNQQVALDLKYLDLLELRFNNGVGTSVEILQQKSQLAESQSLTPVAAAKLQVFEHRLDVLLGNMPDTSSRIGADADLSVVEILPPLGIPSDLLLQRPDLRAAQQQLIASDAGVAVAIAERLPKFSLDGSYFYADNESGSGPISVLTGNLVQPLLNWGQRKAELTRNRALYQEQLYNFSQLYLTAVEEVENAALQERQQRLFVDALEQRKQLLADTVTETEALFSQGINDYLPVLNALQELRRLERSIIDEQLALVNYRIQLHRALGWRGAFGEEHEQH